MRKISICLLAIFATSIFGVSAQNKGEMYVGGSLGLGTTSVISGGNSATGVSFQIAPEFGYFVIDNLKVGASVSYGVESGDPATHIVSVMPNLAYYVRLCDKFYYTPGLSVGFTCGISNDISMPGFGLGLALGSFEFRPIEKLSVSFDVLSFEYALLTYRSNYGNINMNGIDFRLGATPLIGVKYYF